MRRALLLLPGLLALAACAAIAGLQDHQPYPADGGEPSPDGGADSSARDSTAPPVDQFVPDSSAPPPDGGMADVAAEADAGPPTTFSSLGDTSKWEFFDLAPLAKMQGYLGGSFDGRYVYFASNAPTLLRYDSQMPFASETSWLLASSSSIPASNDGLVRLGQYIYDSPALGQLVGRYDTTLPFDADGGGFGKHVPPAVAGYLFQGGCTDGKKVYFAPLYYNPGTGAAPVGTVLVYDPNGPGFFTDSSWTVQDISTFQPGATGFSNCIFDGQYIYFGNYANGYVARYDPAQMISAPGAWVFFLTTQIAPTLYGFMGVVFTGRYVVLVPWYNPSVSYSSIALAYDTQAKFGELMSWTPFDLRGTTDGGVVPTGYLGGQFDGRYVYFAPHQTGLVVRWDSTLPFDAASSWETFDVSALHAGASGFFGTAFDGEFVYFSANTGMSMARFRARDTVANITPVPSFF
jgi:hypothetical protein